MVLERAKLWGRNDPLLSAKERHRIAKAACNQVAYDLGFKSRLADSRLPSWNKQLMKGLEAGNPNPLSPSYAGKVGYLDSIDESHPGYLHFLWRYAVRTKGSTATFQELADQMNIKSGAPGEVRPTLSMHMLQLFRWSRKKGGVEKAANEKPFLNDEQRRQRNAWAREHFEKFVAENNVPSACLDEKWFYTSSRRRRRKILPLGPNEQEGADFLPAPKVRSRRHPIKIIIRGGNLLGFTFSSEYLTFSIIFLQKKI